MASLIIFLCLSAFMFAAGYHWRKMKEHHDAAASQPAYGNTRESLWQEMLRKI